jgi:site-specific DNA-methyltransferase (adenine-specific)
MVIYNGNNIDVLKNLKDNTVDSIVTDPPYGISFMNKKWDYDVPSIELWRECIRVLKPGGHIVSFSSPRTYHRMVVNLEDAGFTIKDMIGWIYSTGFPKSMNISKAIDKKNGLLETQSQGFSFSGDDGRKSELKQNLQFRSDYGYKYEPKNEKSIEFEGYGTHLKPAIEPIVLAFKPISEKTIVDNILKWNTGALNIDGCRVPTNGEENPSIKRRQSAPPKNNIWEDKRSAESYSEYRESEELGRFPANIIHDGSQEVQDIFPNSKSSDSIRKNNIKTGEKGIYGKYEAVDSKGYSDSGNSSRFFYCAKASNKDRDEGLENFELKNNMRVNAPRNSEEEKTQTLRKNYHPTVKPTDLMRYLCRLITPKNGIVLDPFMGSGSTGKAAILEGFDFIGIELEEEFCKIAEARINHVKK